MLELVYLPYFVGMCKETPPASVSRAAGLTNNVAKNRKAIYETIISQNLLGLKSESRLEELFFCLRKRKLLAVCVQETWRPGSETLKNGNCLIFLVGLKEEQMMSNSGEQGAGSR